MVRKSTKKWNILTIYVREENLELMEAVEELIKKDPQIIKLRQKKNHGLLSIFTMHMWKFYNNYKKISDNLNLDIELEDLLKDYVRLKSKDGGVTNYGQTTQNINPEENQSPNQKTI